LSKIFHAHASLVISGMTKGTERKDCDNDGGKEDMELAILFDLAVIANATDNFSINKKLGEGGFGPMYKVNNNTANSVIFYYFEKYTDNFIFQGTLPEGKDIAVKRLSMNSRQGLNELKNEVILIAKLQHRNLVKLLGCCIQENENMLVYEYMSNKSLDSFIFGLYLDLYLI
jgi:serine/threonine protein kinase